MSKFDPSAHIPRSNMSAYIGSPPKAPLDPGTAEFVKGKPAIVEPAVRTAKDWRYYESTIIRNEQLNAALLKEYKEGGAWREHYKSWRDACEPLGLSRRRIDELIQEDVESRRKPPTSPLSEKAVELAKVNALPLLGITDEELLGVPATVHAGPAPMADRVPQTAPKPVPEHQPRERNDNGKPIYAMPVWRESEELCGKLINRVDALNRLVPDPKKQKQSHASLKEFFATLQAWHEMARR